MKMFFQKKDVFKKLINEINKFDQPAFFQQLHKLYKGTPQSLENSDVLAFAETIGSIYYIFCRSMDEGHKDLHAHLKDSKNKLKICTDEVNKLLKDEPKYRPNKSHLHHVLRHLEQLMNHVTLIRAESMRLHTSVFIYTKTKILKLGKDYNSDIGASVSSLHSSLCEFSDLWDTISDEFKKIERDVTSCKLKYESSLPKQTEKMFNPDDLTSLNKYIADAKEKGKALDFLLNLVKKEEIFLSTCRTDLLKRFHG